MKFSKKVTRAYDRGGMRGLCGQALRYLARKIDGYRFDPYVLEAPRFAKDATSLVARVAAARRILDDATLVPDRLKPPNGDLATIVHAYYPDKATKILSMLLDAGIDEHIFLSTDSIEKKNYLQDHVNKFKISAEIRICINRGRDIYPKLFCFSDVNRRYEFVLHLHTKQSYHSDHLRGWGDYLLSNLIGSASIAGSNRALLESDDVGLVYPVPFPPIAAHLDWAGNLPAAVNLCGRLGLAVDPRAPTAFPSGSMFFARSKILAPLLDLGLSADDFEPERGQTDGTLAHVIERLIGALCEAAGLRVTQTIAPEPLLDYMFNGAMSGGTSIRTIG